MQTKVYMFVLYSEKLVFFFVNWWTSCEENRNETSGQIRFVSFISLSVRDFNEMSWIYVALHWRHPKNQNKNDRTILNCRIEYKPDWSTVKSSRCFPVNWFAKTQISCKRTKNTEISHWYGEAATLPHAQFVLHMYFTWFVANRISMHG